MQGTPTKIKEFIPPALRRSLRKNLRTLSRPIKAVKRLFNRQVDQAELEQGLRQIGLVAGDIVMVHSSLSSLGSVSGGALTVLKALLEVTGSSGIVVMPAYPIYGPAYEYLSANPLFDPGQTPSRMGKITEIFRNWPGVKRSIHPTHSICALGRDAHQLSLDHYRSPTPFGHETPFYRLLEMNAWILGLGVDLSSMTFYHVFEDIREDFPLVVYYSKPLTARVLVDGTVKRIHTLVHNPKIVRYRIENDPEIRAVVTRNLLKMGFLRFGKMGDGSAYIIRSRDLITGLEEMLLRGITIYNTKRMHFDGWSLPHSVATDFLMD